jgi:probable DNA metabolism protein
MGLVALFAAMGGDGAYAVPPRCGSKYTHCAATDGNGQGDLFGNDDQEEWQFNEADIAIAAALHSVSPAAKPMNLSVLPPQAGRLLELSPNAYGDIAHAWMSELPIAAEIIRFGQKILAAADSAAGDDGRRRAAEVAATDHCDPDVNAVQAAAYKTLREFDRLRGLLRFSPGEDGAYVAFCEPDHFVLPALGPHFRERFGETPWAIVDNRRSLCLCCEQGQMPRLCGLRETALAGKVPGGEWEELWRCYHQTINNESRNNPELQRRFMPKRYWKYLTEL